MSYHSRFSYLFITTGLLMGAVVWLGGSSAKANHGVAPQLTSITPTVGPLGTQIFLKGTNLTADNTVMWGFGQALGVAATGAPSNQTLVFRLNSFCPPETSCASVPAQGWVDITVSNEHGTSNVVRFLLAPHNSTCYAVDNLNNPGVIRPVACTDATCNAGPCAIPSPSPSSTPTPTVTPTPTPSKTPTPTPSPAATSSDASKKAGSSGSSSGVNGRVAGAQLSGPSATDRKAADFIQNKQVPAVVAALYRQVYGRPITHCQSDYWKFRARTDKATVSKLRGAMQWQSARNRNPVFSSCLRKQKAAATAGNTVTGLISAKDINRLFQATHAGNNPTTTQYQYWLGRLNDKKMEGAMLGAMRWHVQQGTGY